MPYSLPLEFSLYMPSYNIVQHQRFIRAVSNYHIFCSCFITCLFVCTISIWRQKMNNNNSEIPHTKLFVISLTKHASGWYRTFLLLIFFLVNMQKILFSECIFLHSMCTHACKFHLMISQQIFSYIICVTYKQTCVKAVYFLGENSRGYGMWRVEKSDRWSSKKFIPTYQTVLIKFYIYRVDLVFQIDREKEMNCNIYLNHKKIIIFAHLHRSHIQYLLSGTLA